MRSKNFVTGLDSVPCQFNFMDDSVLTDLVIDFLSHAIKVIKAYYFFF